MTTIRSRIPVLLQDLMFKGVRVTFSNSFGEPMIEWTDPDGSGGHFHLTELINGQYGANSIAIERLLSVLLTDPEKSNDN